MELSIGRVRNATNSDVAPPAKRGGAKWISLLEQLVTKAPVNDRDANKPKALQFSIDFDNATDYARFKGSFDTANSNGKKPGFFVRKHNAQCRFYPVNVPEGADEDYIPTDFEFVRFVCNPDDDNSASDDDGGGEDLLS